MAPISSGSSTWTSSGIPFSFVSMATGIGPSSSGSQATVASVVTSTLLAGLGFSGGVISSFPSSVWPSRAPTHNPAATRQTAEPTKDAATSASMSVATDNSEAGTEDSESSREDGEREGEDKDEEEEEEEKEEKKERKGSRRAGKHKMRDDGTVVNKYPEETPESTAKEKPPTDVMPPGADQLEVYTHRSPDSNLSVATLAADEMATFPTPRGPTGRDQQHWPFSIHTGELTNVLNAREDLLVDI